MCFFENKKVRKLGLSLVIIALIVGMFFICFKPAFNNYQTIPSDGINPTVSKAVDLLYTLNTFFLGLSSGLFAFLGWMEKSRERSEIHIYLAIASLTFIFLAFYCGYQSMSEVLNQISQNQIALIARQSLAMQYLRIEFQCIMVSAFIATIMYIFGERAQANE